MKEKRTLYQIPTRLRKPYLKTLYSTKVENLKAIKKILDSFSTPKQNKTKDKINPRWNQFLLTPKQEWDWSSDKSLPILKNVRCHRNSLQFYQNFTEGLSSASLKLLHIPEWEGFQILYMKSVLPWWTHTGMRARACAHTHMRRKRKLQTYLSDEQRSKNY